MVLTMTDPDETASLIAEITGAWREHQAAAAAGRPQTYQEAMALQLPDQIERHHELTDRDTTARSIGSPQDRGEYDEERARILPLGKYQPLTAAEHLELLALGEAIASYYQAPCVRRPRRPGRGDVGADRGRKEHHGGLRPGRLPGVGRRAASVRGYGR
jgi:hypothetical protein